MSKYELIAFDMDGTLLNSEKEISEENLKAIKEAVNAGKKVTICSGRGIAELKPYFDLWEDIDYVISGAGALVYDLKNRKVLKAKLMPAQLILDLMEFVTASADVMPHMQASENSYVQADQASVLDRYKMGQFQGLFDDLIDSCDNIIEFQKEHMIDCVKLNLYYHSEEECEVQRDAIAERFDVDITTVMGGSLEVSGKNIHKGYGLGMLCEVTGLTMDQIIAVGDSDNDIGMLNCAGLSVAMANANANAKAAADVMVADNNHDGCAEAIRKYLL